MAESRPKSPMLQFAGCVLISLGLLDILLALKSGDTPDAFPYALCAIGVLSLLTGLWRQRS